MAHAKRILLVEDNEDLALLLSEALTDRGHTVRMAHDGVTALDIANDFDAELAILDLGVPGIDGLELARRLQRREPSRKTPLLFAVTGFDDASDREHARQAGFDRFFVKPLLPETLETAIEELEE
ncbi:MAG: response regulator [Myxococcales bacterium]